MRLRAFFDSRWGKLMRLKMNFCCFIDDFVYKVPLFAICWDTIWFQSRLCWCNRFWSRNYFIFQREASIYLFNAPVHFHVTIWQVFKRASIKIIYVYNIMNRPIFKLNDMHTLIPLLNGLQLLSTQHVYDFCVVSWLLIMRIIAWKLRWMYFNSNWLRKLCEYIVSVCWAFFSVQ